MFNSNLTNEEKKKIGLYLIQDPTTLATYAGSGILDDRRYKHEYLLKRGVHPNYKLQMLYNKNPNLDFIGVPVEEPFLNVDQLRELALNLEQDIIDEHISNPLFLNIAVDARAPQYGVKQSEETIQKRVAKNIGRKNTAEGIANCIAAQKRLNENRTPEERQILKDRLIATHNLPEHKAKMSQSTTNLWKDPVYREKVVKSLQGKVRSKETSEKLSLNAKNTWQNLSEEEKAKRCLKLHEGNVGRIQSDEEKAKRSIAQKKRFAK